MIYFNIDTAMPAKRYFHSKTYIRFVSLSGKMVALCLISGGYRTWNLMVVRPKFLPQTGLSEKL